MRPNRLLPTLAIAAVVAFGVGFATVAAPAMHLGAFAAAAAKPTPTPSNSAKVKAQARCDAFVNDLAGKLKTSAANLKTQVKAAIDDQIAQAVKDGTMTQKAADALKKKVDAAQGCQGLPSFTARRGFAPRMEALKDIVGAAATALNVTPAALQADIMSGKTLQQVAPAGMTQQKFDDAFTAALHKILDPRVAAKTMTTAQETKEIDESIKIANRLWSTPLPHFGGTRHAAPGTAPSVTPTASPSTTPKIQ